MERIKYEAVETWQKAPERFNWTRLQTGELCLVEENGKRFVLAFCKGLRIHPEIVGAPLPRNYKELKKDRYPQFDHWGEIPAQLEWVKSRIPAGKMAIMGVGYDFYVIVHLKNSDAFKAHLELQFADLPKNFGLVRVDRYPEFDSWKSTNQWVNDYGEGVSYEDGSAFSIAEIPVVKIGDSLKNGEYTLLCGRNWVPLGILAKRKGVCRITNYRDYADMNEIKRDFTFVSRS